MNREHLYKLLDGNVLCHLDVHFAKQMETLNGAGNSGLLLAAALTSAATRQGHICLDLTRVAGTDLMQECEGNDSVLCPNHAQWRAMLQGSAVVGIPGDYRPLILDDRSRLYLYRYWNYQDKLVHTLRERIDEPMDVFPLEKVSRTLDNLFPEQQGDAPDWQKIAAFVAVRKRFAVISGGPGTGKTTTIAKILALLLELQTDPGRLHTALAAPTGKAAARLQEAIKRAKGTLHCSEICAQSIPEEASTIHRLLGTIPGSPYFRHHAKNLLPVDVVVVDEASMVDLALMSKLVQALSPKARLILLGDKDQLASVEAGAVLGDICDTGRLHGYSRSLTRQIETALGCTLDPDPGGASHSLVGDCIVQLQKSYRFGSESRIAALGRAVNAGDGESAIALLKSSKRENVQWNQLPSPNALPDLIRNIAMRNFRSYLGCSDPIEIFHLFEHLRILCAVREGPFGVSGLNRLVEKILAEQGWMEPRQIWYAGRPVLIRSNNYHLGLFNGDVGITLPDPDFQGSLRVFFPAAQGTFRKFHPLRLPDHETVFAMTVHKSQGSEFNEVLLILPDRDVPVLTRELIYTAVTRAKERITIWADEEVFKKAVARRIERMSGLRDALWQD